MTTKEIGTWFGIVVALLGAGATYGVLTSRLGVAEDKIIENKEIVKKIDEYQNKVEIDQRMFQRDVTEIRIDMNEQLLIIKEMRSLIVEMKQNQ